MRTSLLLFIAIVLSFAIGAEEIFYANLASPGGGFINSRGEIVISFDNSLADNIFNPHFLGIPIAVIPFEKPKREWALLTHDGKWLYRSDKEIRPASYTRVWERVNDITWRLIDFQGKEYFRVQPKRDTREGVPPYFDEDALPYFDGGIAIIAINGPKSIIINEYGTVIGETYLWISTSIFNPIYSYIEDGVAIGLDVRPPFDSGVLKKYALFNIDGQEVKKIQEYGYIDMFSEGKLFFSQDGGNYLRTDGTTMFSENILSYGHWFSEGLAAVAFKGSTYYSYIDHEGNTVIDGERLGITDANPFTDGLACVSVAPTKRLIVRNFEWGTKQGGLWGVIDKKGNWVIKPKYPVSFMYNRGLALLITNYTWTFGSESQVKRILPGKRYVYIDKKGNIIWDSLKQDYSETIDKFRVIDQGFSF